MKISTLAMHLKSRGWEVYSSTVMTYDAGSSVYNLTFVGDSIGYYLTDYTGSMYLLADAVAADFSINDNGTVAVACWGRSFTLPDDSIGVNV